MSNRLTSLEPAVLYTQIVSISKGFPPEQLRLRINGLNLTNYGSINSTNINEKVKIFLKKPDNEPQEVQLTDKRGYNDSSYDINISADKWLMDSKPILVYAIIDGAITNTLEIKVIETLQVPPLIKGFYPKTVNSTNEKPVTFFGDNFGEYRGTLVTINGEEASIASFSRENQNVSVWLPNSVINASGVFPVVVKSVFGLSNSYDLPINMLLNIPNVPLFKGTPNTPSTDRMVDKIKIIKPIVKKN